MKNKIDHLIQKGIDYLNKNQIVLAEKIFKDLILDNPDNFIIYSYLIPILINQNKIEESQKYALTFYQKSNQTEISSLYMGVIYFKLNKLKESLNFFESVLNKNFNNYDALVNKGVILFKLNKNLESMKYLEYAIKLKPNNPIGYVSYAAVLEDESKIEQSANYLKKAINLNPKDFESIHALSLLQLYNQEYIQGWKNFDLRWFKKDLDYKYKGIPELKNLLNIKGKKILIWYEQGFGDTLNFTRYVELLIQMGALVTFEVQKPLLSLYKNNFEIEVTDLVKKNDYDYQAPLMSLIKLFGVEDSTIKLNKYIKSKDSKILFWKNKLQLSTSKINIGIAISGNANHLKEKRRQINLEYFLDFLSFCKIYLIQRNITESQHQLVTENKDLVYLGDKKDWQDFDDTSAIVNNMDLIVSIDTSLIHLSGSMNKKSLLLLAKPNDWRWAKDNTKCPKWYDSVHIIRQKNRNNWQEILGEVENFIKNISTKNSE